MVEVAHFIRCQRPPCRASLKPLTNNESVPPVTFTFSTAGELRNSRRREFRPRHGNLRVVGDDNHRMPAIAQLVSPSPRQKWPSRRSISANYDRRSSNARATRYCEKSCAEIRHCSNAIVSARLHAKSAGLLGELQQWRNAEIKKRKCSRHRTAGARQRRRTSPDRLATNYRWWPPIAAEDFLHLHRQRINIGLIPFTTST